MREGIVLECRVLLEGFCFWTAWEMAFLASFEGSFVVGGLVKFWNCIVGLDCAWAV